MFEITELLTSNHHWRYQFVQEGLEIRCKINIKTHFSFNMVVFKCFKDIMKELHIELMEETIRIILVRENYTKKLAQKL